MAGRLRFHPACHQARMGAYVSCHRAHTHTHARARAHTHAHVHTHRAVVAGSYYWPVDLPPLYKDCTLCLLY